MLNPQQIREIVDKFFGGKNAITKEEAYKLTASVAIKATRSTAKSVRAVTDRMFGFNQKDSS